MMDRMDFNDVAPPPQTDFTLTIEAYFDRETAHKVTNLFDQLGLPVPEKQNEFLKGTDGPLVFLNKYGVVIRIESVDTHENQFSEYDRVDDTPWVIRPLASFSAGKAVVEICPGTETVRNNIDAEEIRHLLSFDKINFWDAHAGNIGRVPVRTPSFPEGVPVVIDRGAVMRLAADVRVVKDALVRAERAAAEEALQDLYGPLCGVFVKAWDGKPRDMQPFWDLCADYVCEGKLVAGWNGGAESWTKQGEAAASARVYEKKFTGKVRRRLLWQVSPRSLHQ